MVRERQRVFDSDKYHTNVSGLRIREVVAPLFIQPQLQGVGLREVKNLPLFLR
jgi:hypothetical protein